MDDLIKFACGGIRKELAIVLLKKRARKREEKIILSRIKENKCVISYGVECQCQECLDYSLAFYTVGDASTKEEAIKNLLSEFPLDKAIKYSEIMEDLSGFPI